jgi:hypothetical protein
MHIWVYVLYVRIYSMFYRLFVILLKLNIIIIIIYNRRRSRAGLGHCSSGLSRRLKTVHICIYMYIHLHINIFTYLYVDICKYSIYIHIYTAKTAYLLNLYIRMYKYQLIYIYRRNKIR